MKWRLMLERNGELTDASRRLLRDMERYAASVACRHRQLVAYFGDKYLRDDCSACDYCLEELETAADPIVLARKILSCVARVGQRFGIAHVANVLCGSATDQVTGRHHHELTTFGLLRDVPSAEVRGYIEQLIAHGFLKQTDDAFPVVTLTERGVELMKNPASHPDLVLARQRRPTPPRPGETSPLKAIMAGRRQDLFSVCAPCSDCPRPQCASTSSFTTRRFANARIAENRRASRHPGIGARRRRSEDVPRLYSRLVTINPQFCAVLSAFPCLQRSSASPA
jgi:superfamily II DNA helicase RecQ